MEKEGQYWVLGRGVGGGGRSVLGVGEGCRGMGGQYWVWGRSVLGVGEGCSWLGGQYWVWGRSVLGVGEGCRGMGGQYWVLGRGVGGWEVSTGCWGGV